MGTTSFAECFYNFNKDTSEKQIIVLKPDYELLIWKLPSTETELEKYSSGENPFQFFRKNYLETINEYPDNSEKDAEIIEAWKHSDEQVHEESTAPFLTQYI